MANISEYISKIKTAIYGKDVRGSLADGLDAVNKETEAATTLTQEIEQRQTSIEKQFDDQIANMTLADPSSAELVAGRTNVNTGKSYDTIGRRLDAEHADVTAQLADAFQQLKGFSFLKTDTHCHIDDYIHLVKNTDKERQYWDWTDAVNTALSENRLVFFGKDIYGITGRIFVPPEHFLIGTYKFTQTQPTAMNYDPNRLIVADDTKFLIRPTDTVNPTFNFERNAGARGIGFFYPEQKPTFTSASQLIQYPLTIKAKDGFIFEDIYHWGATDFLEASGEAIYINKVFGYNFGQAIYLHDCSDICYIDNVRLNPNIVRPVREMLTFNRNNGSTALKLERCDGVLIGKFFAMLYKTDIKYDGGTSVQIHTLSVDMSGTVLDVSGDAGNGIMITNFMATIGYGDENDCFIRMNKDTSKLIIPVSISNFKGITSDDPKWYGNKQPDYAFRFECDEGYRLNLQNADVFGFAKELIYNQKYNFTSGEVTVGSDTIVLTPKAPTQNEIINSSNFQIKPGTVNEVNNWDIYGGYSIEASVMYESGNVLIRNNVDVPNWAGLHQGFYTKGGKKTVVVKAKNISKISEAKVIVNRNYGSGSNNGKLIQGYESRFNSKGIVKINLACESLEYIDIIISAGTKAGDNLELEFAIFSADAGGWTDYHPIETNTQRIIQLATQTQSWEPTYLNGWGTGTAGGLIITKSADGFVNITGSVGRIDTTLNTANIIVLPGTWRPPVDFSQIVRTSFGIASLKAKISGEINVELYLDSNSNNVPTVVQINTTFKAV